MSQLTNENQFNALLSKFLENDTSHAENENKEMERWLDEAANNLREKFQIHRGKINM